MKVARKIDLKSSQHEKIIGTMNCDGCQLGWLWWSFCNYTNIATYTNIESLCHIIETNVTLYINYNSKKPTETTNGDNIEVKEPMVPVHAVVSPPLSLPFVSFPLKWDKYVRLRAIRRKQVLRIIVFSSPFPMWTRKDGSNSWG